MSLARHDVSGGMPAREGVPGGGCLIHSMALLIVIATLYLIKRILCRKKNIRPSNADSVINLVCIYASADICVNVWSWLCECVCLFVHVCGFMCV